MLPFIYFPNVLKPFWGHWFAGAYSSYCLVYKGYTLDRSLGQVANLRFAPKGQFKNYQLTYKKWVSGDNQTRTRRKNKLHRERALLGFEPGVSGSEAGVLTDIQQLTSAVRILAGCKANFVRIGASLWCACLILSCVLVVLGSNAFLQLSVIHQPRF